ncbi:carboxypeptidase-like regulatory domain-containing protein [Hymenobacter sp. DG01]|uniref:carboxypeptidase-like regulatory domain-containing protein n=1 Tax=Hymenobacter sp. DG01 TaxID=2584940 RepID=UPI0011213B8F|nr:carboxypeptidase-like regulatory domain-containing protein [Hymenobacter sp. DG01]
MCRFLLLASFSVLLGFPLVAAAQTAGPAAQPASERLALAAPAPAAAAPVRLECNGKFTGQVLTEEGQPLIGATVTIVGGRSPYITNSEGRYIIQEPVYRGQVLHVAAAGYVDRNVPLTTCDNQAVGLELAEGTRIKRTGKRAGQIVRFGQAYRQ